MAATDSGSRELPLVTDGAETGEKEPDETGAPEPEQEEIPLDADTYGAAMFSIIEDIRELMGVADTDGRPLSLNVTRLCFCSSVLMANYGLQFGMLYFVDRFIVIQAQQEMLHGEPSDALVFKRPAFVITILILWSISILKEGRKVERFARAFNALPRVEGLQDMVIQMFEETENEDEKGPLRVFAIKGLTTGIYWILTIFIVLPKVLITVLLLIFGFQWLMCTPGEADLILNALALEFVINVDEQLYDGLLPKCIKEKIEQVVLLRVKKKHDDLAAKHIADIKAEKLAWNRSIAYYFIPIVASIGYACYTQQYLSAEEASQALRDTIHDIVTTLAPSSNDTHHGHGKQGHHVAHGHGRR